MEVDLNMGRVRRWGGSCLIESCLRGIALPWMMGLCYGLSYALISYYKHNNNC